MRRSGDEKGRDGCARLVPTRPRYLHISRRCFSTPGIRPFASLSLSSSSLLVLFFLFPFLSFLHSFLTPDSFIHFFSSLFLSHSPTIVVCHCRVITQPHLLFCRSGKFFYNPCCSPTSVAITFVLGSPHLSKNKSLLFSSLSRELLLSFHSFSYKGLRSS